MGHYALAIHYEEMPHVKKWTYTQNKVSSLVNFPRVFRVRDSGYRPPRCEKEVILDSWRDMLKELEAGGYSVTRVSRATGVPRRTVQRWFNGDEEIPGYFLFSKVLYLYCYYKCKAPKNTSPAERDKNENKPHSTLFNKGGAKAS